MPGRNSKHLLLANEVNFSEGARNCSGGQIPNHTIEGNDFIFIVTSNKNYSEDLNRDLRGLKFGKPKESECTSS